MEHLWEEFYAASDALGEHFRTKLSLSNYDEFAYSNAQDVFYSSALQRARYALIDAYLDRAQAAADMVNMVVHVVNSGTYDEPEFELVYDDDMTWWEANIVATAYPAEDKRMR